MNWDDFNSAFNQASATINIADRHVAQMARMCAGRLKASNVSTSVLIEMKKELAGFNMHTKKWK